MLARLVRAASAASATIVAMTTDAPSAPERVEADLLDPELYRRDPQDVWSWMRANEPVYRDARNGLWGPATAGACESGGRMG